ncbi:GNAT family N-acetyltransferase [Lutimaribacter saemankumensis]|uniref:Protein N-acetyltransferase, RimJ/RimL family n=1 Tax=Lutimaribacter saemankumensis TaxID=490829 RepID=A0A1G8JTJ2_9RHOB|nr:GNAT family N-acetyltransferase [Lutimaribacter saemankumensis]SDI34526.1 Protein N-acetyltransferase, RimJ/RimL family [Lutimaribacter saemankumensis]
MTQYAFDIPTVDAGPVILRAPREDDLDALTAFMSGERSHFVGGPASRAECWGIIARILGHWALRGYGYWYIEDKQTGQPVGGCGFINREGWEEPELGWQVWDGFEGRGIAQAAARAARTHGARHFGLNGVISYIVPQNTRSIALARRLGASFERESVLLGHQCHVYRHPQEEAA